MCVFPKRYVNKYEHDWLIKWVRSDRLEGLREGVKNSFWEHVPYHGGGGDPPPAKKSRNDKM